MLNGITHNDKSTALQFKMECFLPPTCPSFHHVRSINKVPLISVPESCWYQAFTCSHRNFITPQVFLRILEMWLKCILNQAWLSLAVLGRGTQSWSCRHPQQHLQGVARWACFVSSPLRYYWPWSSKEVEFTSVIHNKGNLMQGSSYLRAIRSDNPNWGPWATLRSATRSQYTLELEAQERTDVTISQQVEAANTGGVPIRNWVQERGTTSAQEASRSTVELDKYPGFFISPSSLPLVPFIVLTLMDARWHGILPGKHTVLQCRA